MKKRILEIHRFIQSFLRELIFADTRMTDEVLQKFPPDTTHPD